MVAVDGDRAEGSNLATRVAAARSARCCPRRPNRRPAKCSARELLWLLDTWWVTVDARAARVEQVLGEGRGPMTFSL
jgi:hypothetical protein